MLCCVWFSVGFASGLRLCLSVMTVMWDFGLCYLVVLLCWFCFDYQELLGLMICCVSLFMVCSLAFW